MSGPLSRSVAGASYKGAFGSTAGDLARAGASFGKGLRDQEEERKQAAFQAAILALKQAESTRGDQQLDLNRAKGAQDALNSTEGFNVDYERLNAQRANDDALRAGQGLDRTERNRHNLETEDALRNNPRGLAVAYGPNGEIMIVNKKEESVVPTHARGASTPSPSPSVPTNPDGTPISAGAKPNSNEQQNAMLWTSIQPSIARVEEYFKNGEPPGIGSQILGKASKADGSGIITGPMSAVAAPLANTALGKVNPDFQAVIPDMTKIYRAYVYVTTGKQLNESEAADAAMQYVVQAGDAPQTVQNKLQSIRVMSDAVQAASQRALNFQEQIPKIGGGLHHAPKPPADNNNAKADRWDELTAGGMSPDEATAQVLREFK